MSIDPSPDLRAHGDGVLDRLAGTTRRKGPGPLAARLEDLGAILAADVASVDVALDALAADSTDVAERAAAHLLRRPGKRIRASCALLAARLGPDRGAPGAAREAAIAAELVHAATLLHDDVIDEGTERRGALAARVVYGNSASILGGDHLLVEALRRVDRAGDPVLLRELLAAIADMVAAEAFQLERRGDGRQVIDEPPAQRMEAYLSVARGKTAALFRWALRAGARIGGLPARDVDAAGELGTSIGLAFQLIDDALDLDGDPRVIGKNALADLREGKITWPLLVALERDPGLAPELLTGDVSIADRVRATGAVVETRAEAQRQVTRGLRALETLPDTPARRAFAALVAATLGEGELMSTTVRDGSGAMFDRIAGRYDLLNRVMSLGLDQRWRRRLVHETARGAPPGDMLDLATGTGDVAILGRSIGRQVIGLDPSKEMLARAQQKSPELILIEGSAEAIPFGDARFAMITMSFGIRNVPDRRRALREMARVLVPGGRVGILELGEPRHRWARFHVHQVVPRLGAWLSNDAEYAYLARSIAAFPPPEAFAESMREAGFEQVNVERLSFGALHLYTAQTRGSGAS